MSRRNGALEAPPMFEAGLLGRSSGVVMGAVMIVMVMVAVTGCGSSSSSSAAAVGPVCTQVSAVLADGPDPDADPVGYAEAQILPLGQIKTSDKDLQAAVTSLSQAYRSFSNTNGAKAATGAVKAASARVDAICPGATS